MCKQRYVFQASLALSFLVGIGSHPCRAGYITFQVSVDTSALNGKVGNLDFQFNPGGNTAGIATATITDFQTLGGILSQPALLAGDAAGSLPSTLTLDNGTAYNDAFQGFAYGQGFSFLLSLSYASSGGTFGSAFALSLYDAAGVMPLLTTDPNGSVLTVNLNSNGTAFVQTFPQSSTNATPVVLVTSSVPEPSSLILIMINIHIGLIMHYKCKFKCIYLWSLW